MQTKRQPPDFICIGAQKAGTSWLYRNLSLHPHIYLPPLKEIHYFDQLDEQANLNFWNICKSVFQKTGHQRRWRRIFLRRYCGKTLLTMNLKEARWFKNYLFGERSFNWYEGLFSEAGSKITGDITPCYSTISENTIRQVAENLPGTKIILILRDIIERTWSQYRMGVKTKRWIDELEVRPGDVPNWFQENITRSNYMNAIETWGKYFAEDQFYIGFFDVLATRPQQLFDEIADFLQIDRFRPDGIDAVVHQGEKRDMPQHVRTFLFDRYREEMRLLSQYFEHKRQENYPQCWIDSYT